MVIAERMAPTVKIIILVLSSVAGAPFPLAETSLPFDHHHVMVQM